MEYSNRKKRKQQNNLAILCSFCQSGKSFKNRFVVCFVEETKSTLFMNQAAVPKAMHVLSFTEVMM
jgi:hypothetical protein